MENRCKFWLPKKKRFCANVPLTPSLFCGNHTPRSNSQWIPYPIDPSHSVLEDNLEGHLKRCPLLKQVESLTHQPFYQKGINAGKEEEDPQEIEALTSKRVEGEPKSGELNHILSEMKRTVYCMSVPDFYKLVEKIESVHKSICKDIRESCKVPEACGMWIKREVDRKLPFQEKHVMQQVSILGNMEDFGLIKSSMAKERADSDDVNGFPVRDDSDYGNGVPAVVEFGAGRGQLTQMLADCYGIKRVFLVERKSYKLKADRSLRQKESVILQRLRIDIEDLNLNAVETLQGGPYVAIGKHLCGPATDLTLRCCLGEQSNESNGEDGFVNRNLRGLSIATCCHHLCQWKHYINKKYVLELGITKEEFLVIIWLTPPRSVDYSPAVSLSGEFVAVASYGSGPWKGEFHELNTDIVVFRASDPGKRVVLCERGGWPTWSGDSVVYFHRRDDAGWWTIFRADLPAGDLDFSSYPLTPTRVTPPGLHCFTPAAFHDGKRIAVATRRKETKFRHVEIFDAETETFRPVTSALNPNFHHYNPFVSPDTEFVGYHRFRGESMTQWGGESIIPHLEPVLSPIRHLKMLRLDGSFPTFSPDAQLVAYNPEFEGNTGVKIVKSDGSKSWTLINGRLAFYNSWSPTERHVIYTSIGPIFQSARTTVQIARIEFDPSDLNGEKEEIQCSVKILTREDTGNNAFASCSPDGKSLVFRSGRTGHKNLYIVDAVNGDFNDGIRQLTEGPCIDTMPSWSPKGDLIAFSSNRHKPEDVAVFSIYVIKPDGSGLRRINVAGDDADRERINHVCFSHDGEWLLFTANLGGVTAEPVSWPNQFQPYGDLYVVKLDGSGLRRLTWNGYENGTPTWHTGDEVDLGGLRLGACEIVGDKLKGQFDEPLWISCDI